MDAYLYMHVYACMKYDAPYLGFVVLTLYSWGCQAEVSGDHTYCYTYMHVNIVCMYLYIYHVFMHVHIHIYIYIYTRT